AVGQEVVQHIVDAIRFFLLAYHDAVSSSIGILDRLHKILISLYNPKFCAPGAVILATASYPGRETLHPAQGFFPVLLQVSATGSETRLLAFRR
ncbi:MAG: hypothetical protein WBA86_21765, partial [Nodosilinea sp.]